MPVPLKWCRWGISFYPPRFSSSAVDQTLVTHWSWPMNSITYRDPLFLSSQFYGLRSGYRLWCGSRVGAVGEESAWLVTAFIRSHTEEWQGVGRRDGEAQEGAASLSGLESGMLRLHVEHQQMTPWSKKCDQSEPSEQMLMLRRSNTSLTSSIIFLQLKR